MQLVGILPVDDVEEATLNPQVLFQLRVIGTPGTDRIRNVVKAVVWWSHVADPTQVEVSTVQDVDEGMLVSVLVNCGTRQRGVEMMALVYRANMDGDLIKTMQREMPATREVVITEARLTSASKSGVFFERAPSSVPDINGPCERVVIDTGGCDTAFNFTEPYAHGEKQNLPASDGTVVEIPVPCDPAQYREPIFATGARSGAAVLTDGNHVDKARTLPHMLAAMPLQTNPHTAVASSFTVDEWAAAMENKAVMVVPHLTGGMASGWLSESHRETIISFVQAGGVVVVAGSPIRASSFINYVFGVEIKDVRPDRGGISFLPGTHRLSSPLDDGFVSACAAEWTDQNSFSFVDQSTLPPSSRVLQQVSADPSKVVAFDFSPPNAPSGRVLYFAADFYDIPGQDTACILRESVMRAMDSAAALQSEIDN